MSLLGGLLYQPQTSSSVITDIVNKTTTDVIISSSNSSSQSNTATNNIDITNIKAGEGCSIDITAQQKIIQTPTFTGISETDISSKLDTQLKDALNQSIKNSSRGIQLLTTPGVSESINKHINDIAASVSNMSIVSCLQKNTASNDIAISNIQSNCPAICNNTSVSFNQHFSPIDYAKLCTTTVGSAQDIVQAAVASCISKNTQATEAISKLASELVLSSENETAGVEVDKIVDSIGSAISGIVSSGQIIFIVIGIIFVYMMFSGGNKKSQ